MQVSRFSRNQDCGIRAENGSFSRGKSSKRQPEYDMSQQVYQNKTRCFAMESQRLNTDRTREEKMWKMSTNASAVNHDLLWTDSLEDPEKGNSEESLKFANKLHREIVTCVHVSTGVQGKMLLFATLVA